MRFWLFFACLGLLAGCGRLGFALDKPPVEPDARAAPEGGVATITPTVDGGLGLDASGSNPAADSGSVPLDAATTLPQDAAPPTQDAQTPPSGDAATATDAAAMADAAPATDGGAMNDAGPATKLVRGFTHMLFIRAGTLYAWGNNASGQLGTGDKNDRLTPTALAGIWIDACGSQTHSCAIRDDGTMACWGDNSKGQLGLGNTQERTTPTTLPGTGDWMQVACMGNFTCALRAGGALYCWGETLEGALGLGDADGAADVTSPMLVSSGTVFTAVSTAQGDTCAVTNMHALYCWGRNKFGQLGLGSTTPSVTRSPVHVGTTDDWLTPVAGQDQTCAIKLDESLHCWGDEASGARGLTTTVSPTTLPMRVGSGLWTNASSSRLDTCGVMADRALYCWGRGGEGQLGTGGFTDVRLPTRVGTDNDWVEVVSALFTTCARRTDDSVWCWGENADGQLGLGDTSRRSQPTRVTAF